jgi:hypothetical protein
MTYAQLLEELKKLTPEQLQQTAQAAGVDMPTFEIGEVWIASEPFINPSGDGAEPLSAYTGANADPDFDVSDEAIVIPQGGVMLLEVDECLKQANGLLKANDSELSSQN